MLHVMLTIPQAVHTLDPKAMTDLSATVVVVRAQLEHNRRVERERLGLPPKPEDPGYIFDDEQPPFQDPVVQTVLRYDFKDFGFFVYRLDYEVQDKWDRFIEEFDRRLDCSLERSSGGAAIMDRLFCATVQDVDLHHDFSWQKLRDYHNELRSNTDYGPGVDNGVGLTVDTEVLDAMLDPQPGVPPWVYVFDQSFDFAHVQEKVNNDEFPGFFRIAIDSLVPDLWPMLVGAGMSLEELWSAHTFDDARPVWTNAFGVQELAS